MSKVELIAEIAGGHEGHLDRCLELTSAAADAGAHGVKFQFYLADELCEKGHPDYAIFKQLEFEDEEWRKIFARAREAKLQVYGDIFGAMSMEQALRAGVDGYKLHSADLDNRILMEQVLKTGKKIFLGVGGRNRIEIYQTIKAIRAVSPDVAITLMPGHQLFPTTIEEHSLEEIRWFAQAYRDLKIQVGCADHIDGDDPFAVTYPIAAAGAGAVCVEKHLTMDRSAKWEDYEAAIEPKDFALLAENLKKIGQTCGYPVWTEGRQKYRKKSVKLFFAARDLAAGEILNGQDTTFLRPVEFEEPLSAALATGRSLRSPIKAGQKIGGEHVEQKVGVLVNARTASSRLPQKALLKICERETIALLLERVKACKNASLTALCTTEKPEDDVLVKIAKREGVRFFRGPDENVALRLLLAAREFELDHIVRVTGDDLLRDVDMIDLAVESHLKNNADYTFMTGVADCCESEIISKRALEAIVERAVAPENTEYLTWYLDDSSAFVQNQVAAPVAQAAQFRLTLDTEADFKVFKAIFENLYKPGVPVALDAALSWLEEHPEIANLNRDVKPGLSREDLEVGIRF